MCPNLCSAHGACMPSGVCACMRLDCALIVSECTVLRPSSGACLPSGVCACFDGWEGENCSARRAMAPVEGALVAPQADAGIEGMF